MPILENAQVAAVLSVQSQAISRRQLRSCGVAPDAIAWARGRVLDDAGRGVYVLRGSAATWEQRLWVARLALGPVAAISHEAAAAIHRFESFRPGPVTFVVPHGWHRRHPGVHQSRDPWLESVQLHANLPVTSPAQTICDLAATTRKARLRDVLDDAFARKTLTPLDMVAAFDRLRRPGKPGFQMLGEILDDWRDGTKIPTQSRLERETLDLFRRFGGPAPKVAWQYPSREQVPGVADFGYADALLALETDGRRWHDRIGQSKRDKERDATAARHGVQVLRLLWEHVVGDPRGTWQVVVDTYAMRIRQLRGAA